MTPHQLAPLCARPEIWAGPLNEAMGLFEIDSNRRQAMFLAQCAHESASFSVLNENLNYSADALLRTWPNRFMDRSEAMSYERKPKAIANHVYANRGGNGDEGSGDGWLFRGRGPIQITLHDNYERCEVDTGIPFLEEPDRMATTEGAFGSAWFWWRNGCNEVADDGDYDGVSGIINRGDRHKVALHMEERRRLWRVAKEALA